MRRITDSAGLTVGALYRHFAGKENMFASLAEPAINELMTKYSEFCELGYEIIKCGDVHELWNTSESETKLLMSFIYDHFDEFKLIIRRSQGTIFESFVHDMALLEERSTLEYFERMKQYGMNVRKVSGQEFHMLVTANVSAVFIAHSMCEVAAAVATPLFTIIVLFIVDWRLTLVSLLPIMVSFVILALALKKPDGAEHQKNMADCKMKMEGTIIEYIHGMSVIKIFGGTKNAFRRFETDMNSFTKSIHDTAYYNANGMGLYYAFFGAQVLFLLPAAVIMLNNSASYADVLPKILFFLVVCAGLKEPLENMMNVSIDSTKINMGLKRIDELLAEPEIALIGEGKRLTKFDIGFDEVSFAYPGSGIKACDKVSFGLPVGSCNALVGPSGGGKSTIAQLLMRFYEIDEGSIRIGGADIREVTHSELVNNIAYVFQYSFIFNDTIENNIRMGNVNATHDEIIAAAKAANIHYMIMALPDGYNTVVSDSTGLSGGEKQRISIARAILSDAPVVFLGEATASLDPENEVLIQRAIDELVKNKTVLVIAHRLQSVMELDNIIVLDNGRIAEQGTHDELLRLGGRYAALWNEQQTVGCWKLS